MKKLLNCQSRLKTRARILMHLATKEMTWEEIFELAEKKQNEPAINLAKYALTALKATHPNFQFFFLVTLDYMSEEQLKEFLSKKRL